MTMLFMCSVRGPTQSIESRYIKIIGREELIDDPRFATNEERNKHEGFINEIIAEWTKHHTKEEAMQLHRRGRSSRAWRGP